MVQQFKFKANRPVQRPNTNIKPYWKVIEEIIDGSDVILEVLDARMPELSRNEEIERLVNEKNKKLIFILNKSDLIDKELVEKFKSKLKKEAECFIINAKKVTSVKKLREYLIASSKDSEFFKIGVLGYPNTGKSSLINALVRKRKVPVSSKAGTTHGQQWIKLTDKVRIIDSPGVIPLKQNDEIRYALIGSRNPERIKNLDLVAHKIIEIFKDSDNLKKLYKIQESNDPDETIESIGRKLGYLKKGNEVNVPRVAIKIIRDWQTGKLRL